MHFSLRCNQRLRDARATSQGQGGSAGRRRVHCTTCQYTPARGIATRVACERIHSEDEGQSSYVHLRRPAESVLKTREIARVLVAFSDDATSFVLLQQLCCNA